MQYDEVLQRGCYWRTKQMKTILDLKINLKTFSTLWTVAAPRLEPLGAGDTSLSLCNILHAAAKRRNCCNRVEAKKNNSLIGKKKTNKNAQKKRAQNKTTTN